MQAKIAAIVLFVYLNLLVETAGHYQVTMVVFSGRPDPEWFIPQSYNKFNDITKLLQEAEKQKQIFTQDNIPPKLGYRGFLVKYNMIDPPVLIAGPNTIELQMALLESFNLKDFNDNIQADVFKQFKKEVTDAIQASGPQIKQKNQGNLMIENQGSISTSTSFGRRKRYIYEYSPNVWNGVDRTRLNNNCYNYANNKATNTYAQPGRGSGHPNLALTSATMVRNAANNDGLETLEVDPLVQNQPVPKNPNGRKHVVALFMHNLGLDFHWARMDFDGTWSHKMGGTPVVKLAQNGMNLFDPRHYHFPEYHFVCFMYSNRDTVTIA